MPNHRDVGPEIFGVQAGNRIAQPVCPPRVHCRTPASHSPPRRPLRVFTPEVQIIRDLVERPVQADLGDDGPVREVVTPMQRCPAQDLCPHDAVGVVVPAIEQHASKPFRSPHGVHGHPIVEQLVTVPALSIIAVLEWASTTCGSSSSASTQRLSRSRAYRSSSDAHLNSSPLACLTTKLWFGTCADVTWLHNIADPGVLLRVATVDFGGAVGRGVIRND